MPARTRAARTASTAAPGSTAASGTASAAPRSRKAAPPWTAGATTRTGRWTSGCEARRATAAATTPAAGTAASGAPTRALSPARGAWPSPEARAIASIGPGRARTCLRAWAFAVPVVGRLARHHPPGTRRGHIAPGGSPFATEAAAVSLAASAARTSTGTRRATTPEPAATTTTSSTTSTSSAARRTTPAALLSRTISTGPPLAVAPTSTVAAVIIGAPLTAARGHVRDVVVLRHLARIRWRVLSLEHPNQPDVVHAILDGVERLEQPRQAIFLDAQLLLHLSPRGIVGRLHLRIDLGHRRGRLLGGSGVLGWRIRRGRGFRVRRAVFLDVLPFDGGRWRLTDRCWRRIRRGLDGALGRRDLRVRSVRAWRFLG